MENEPEEKPYKPCVGDVVMKGAPEGVLGACGVVLRVYEDMVGGRLYFVQWNRAIVYAKGPERMTQEEIELMGLHPATKAEWLEDFERYEALYAEEKAKLYESVQPYIS